MNLRSSVCSQKPSLLVLHPQNVHLWIHYSAAAAALNLPHKNNPHLKSTKTFVFLYHNGWFKGLGSWFLDAVSCLVSSRIRPHKDSRTSLIQQAHHAWVTTLCSCVCVSDRIQHASGTWQLTPPLTTRRRGNQMDVYCQHHEVCSDYCCKWLSHPHRTDCFSINKWNEESRRRVNEMKGKLRGGEVVCRGRVHASLQETGNKHVCPHSSSQVLQTGSSTVTWSPGVFTQ